MIQLKEGRETVTGTLKFNTASIFRMVIKNSSPLNLNNSSLCNYKKKKKNW